MKDERIIALDGATKISVTAADCTAAAGRLARAHLSGPVASAYLAQALAGAALLGAETSQQDETVIFRLDCPGPLGGFLAECTAAATLRGYTVKKIIDEFDGMKFADSDVLGDSCSVSVMRSVPGTLISSGTALVPVGRKTAGAVAKALDAYFAQSLQRRVRTALAGTAGDDGVPFFARGVAVECPPDGDADAFAAVAARFDEGVAAKAVSCQTFSLRTFLGKIGLPHAEVRSSVPLEFACRCSMERAEAMVAALPEDERRALPPSTDVTCHMCGRTWTVQTARG